MEAPQLQETVIPPGRTFQDVLSAEGGELSSENFALAARDAQAQAQIESDALNKERTFDAALLKNCQHIQQGNPHPKTLSRRFILVLSPKPVLLADWYFTRSGEWLYYFGVGDDKYRYIVAVYPEG